MRFSVVIPCFNRHADLTRAIQSCLAQTFADFEILVVDDHSSPPLEDVCAAFGDERVRYFRNVKNSGVSFSRNVGIDSAKGQYVCFLDSDDVYLPEKLSVLNRRIAEAPPAPALVFHRQWRIFNLPNEGMPLPARLPRLEERLDEYILLFGNFVQTNAFMVERGLAQRIRFDETCRLYEDTKFFLQCWLAAHGGYLACEDILSIYHDFQQHGRLSKKERSSRILPMLLFVRSQCSSIARVGFEAYASADVPFFTAPGSILARIFSAHRAGVPLSRCAVYLARSVLGAANVNRAIVLLRSLRPQRPPAVRGPKRQNAQSV